MSGREQYKNNIKMKIDRFLEKNNDKKYLKGFRYFLVNKSPSTIYEYLTKTTHFINTVQKNPKDLTIDDYTIYLGEIEDRTPSYRIVTYAALKKFSEYLYARQINLINPMMYIERPSSKEKDSTVKKREKGYLETDEIKTIKESIENGIGTKKAKRYQEKTKYRDLAILSIFLNTGIRCSALCNLDFDDIDFESKTIIVTDKGDVVKRYSISDDLSKLLDDYITKERGAQNGPLFIKSNNKRLGYQGVYKLIKKYSSDLSEKNITPHKLRATFGTQLYNATKDIVFVQNCMNHSSPSTTRLYIRGQKNKTKEASEIMSKLISG